MSIYYLGMLIIDKVLARMNPFSVALAKLLLPMEAKVTVDITQVDGTYEFTLSKNRTDAPRNAKDLNEAPFILKVEHFQQMKGLAKTSKMP